MPADRPPHRSFRALRRLAIAAAPRLFLRIFSPDREELGLAGEELAARHLAARGLRLRGRRVLTPRGEVDLWAEAGPLTVCVEVKTSRVGARALERLAGERGARGSRTGPELEQRLRSLRFRPGHRVDGRRLARLRRSAGYLAGRSGRAGGTRAPSRVDLVEVLLDPLGRVLGILHTEDLRRPLR